MSEWDAGGWCGICGVFVVDRWGVCLVSYNMKIIIQL